MTDIVERVARAINDIPAVHEDWDKLDSLTKNCRRIEARAAILETLAAIREPTNRQRRAATDAVNVHVPYATIYRAMLDKLAEEIGGGD